LGTAEAMTCPRCASDDALEVTSLGEVNRRYMCPVCCLTYQAVPFRPAASVHAMEGPSVPTPEQLLAHAFGGWLG
jgi:transposase-like protein